MVLPMIETKQLDFFAQVLRLMLFLIDFPELNKPKWNTWPPTNKLCLFLNFFCRSVLPNEYHEE
jgi:hypothetical protein